MKLSKAEYDALPEALKPMFTEDGEGYSPLFVSAEDVAGLKQKNEELLGETKKAREERAAREAEAQRAIEEAARKKGDFETIEKSYKERIAKLEADHAAALQEREQRLYKLTVGAQAQKLATDLAGEDADLLLPFITPRLQAEGDSIRILDANGQPTANTIDDLVKEFRSDKKFAKVVITSKAQGTRGADSTPPGASGKPENETSEEERLQLYRDNPQEFARRYGVRTN